ncbi:MAG: hypothetical protein RI983_707 [Bacteroidota bacterium]|jgi:hypothetical protein
MAGTGFWGWWWLAGCEYKEKTFFVMQTLPLPLNKSFYEDG